MELKKYPNATLENYSNILILLGLVLALFIVYELINMKSFHKPVKGLTGIVIGEDDSEQSIEIKPVEITEQPVTKAVIPEKILIVDDDIEIEETVLETTETDESDAIDLEVDENIINVEEEEEVVEDVPFLIIEEVPIFPGCKGTKEELRKCFSDKISKFVLKKFNSDIASELGFDVGSKQKIFVMFKINKTGHITGVEARAPHIVLQKEAVRVIKLLPVMIPGKQRGKPVTVKYALPIVFKVE